MATASLAPTRQAGRGATGGNQEERTITPVFTKVRDLPASDNHDYSVSELCQACEKVSGTGSMIGAQRISGLWRLYPTTTKARMELLVSGIALHGVQVTLSDKNPFAVWAKSGEEVPTTRVVVSDIPMSYTNVEIEEALLKMGCKLMSQLKDEYDRDSNGKLTRWKTGRRFIFIATPKEPLPREVKIGIFTAKIYHREQKSVRQKQFSTCFNCFGTAHHAYECTNPTVCRTCKMEGHKAGDPMCGLIFEDKGQGPDEAAVAPTADAADESAPSPGESARPVEPASADSLPSREGGLGDQSAHQVNEVKGTSADSSKAEDSALLNKKDKSKKKGQKSLLQMLSKKRPPSPEDSEGDKKRRQQENGDNVEMAGSDPE